MTVATEESGIESRSLYTPVRVRIAEFDIVITPGDPDLTTIGARNARNAAEDLFESYLLSFDWGHSTSYDYAGLSGIKSIAYDDSSSSQPKSVIKVRGGMVVFQSGTTRAPTPKEIEDMLEKSLYPSESDQLSLTEVLQSMDMFSYVESSSFELFRPSLAPSSSPSSFKPSTVPTFIPNDSTSVDNVSSSPSFYLKNAAPLRGSTTTSTQGTSQILSTISTGAAILIVIVGLIVGRRVLRKQKWKINAPHKFPLEEEEEVQKKLTPGIQDCGKSETNSILSYFLTATATQSRLSRVESPKTVPQSCSSSSEGSLSEFDPEFKTLSIVQIISMNESERDTNMEEVGFTAKEDLTPNMLPSQWEKTPYADVPHQHVLTPLDFLAADGFDKWSDCSSVNFNTKKDLDIAEVDAAFEPDSTWNFEDNEEDKDDKDNVDPFYTPAQPSHQIMGIFARPFMS